MPAGDTGVPDSAREADSDGHEGVWRSRGVTAAAIRVLAIGAPVALGTVAARLVVGMFSAGTSTWIISGTALLAATVVSLLTARLGMRLLPLAVLLKMTMVFPDRAPSRFKVARRAGSAAELRRRLESQDADAREAAITLLALVTALGRHDRKTRGHSERVRLYCDLIGRELGLSEVDCGRLRWVGLLHDIGKLEVAAAVLNKPSKLDDDEWGLIRTHPDSGARIAEPLAQWLGPWFDGIGHHHERYDGMGYPRGLAGDQISLAGRAVAVVDAFETMTAARSYKSPMTTAAARAELTRCAGSHFDPAIVRAFLAIALPRLLWTMGPLTFVVNIPFLRWMPAATERAATLANASVGAASNAVGVTAVSVAIAAAPTQSLAHSHAHPTRVEAQSVSAVRLIDHGHSHAHPSARPGAVSAARPEAARTATAAARVQGELPATPTGSAGPVMDAPRPVTGQGIASEQADDEAGRGAGQPAPPAPAGPTPSAASEPEPAGRPSSEPAPASPTQPARPGRPSGRPSAPGRANRPTPPGQANRPTPPAQANQPTPRGHGNQPTLPAPAPATTPPPGQANQPTPPTPPAPSSPPAAPGRPADRPTPPAHGH